MEDYVIFMGDDAADTNQACIEVGCQLIFILSAVSVSLL